MSTFDILDIHIASTGQVSVCAILAQSSKWREISNSVFPISIYEFNISFSKEWEGVIAEGCYLEGICYVSFLL